MRSFIDDTGKVAWIFDEKTHPKGNANNVEVKKEVVTQKVAESQIKVESSTKSNHSIKKK